VYRGIDSRNSKTVAIKVVDMRQLEDELHRELLNNEIDCLRRLKDSVNIIEMYDVFTTTAHTSIVMEFCECKNLVSVNQTSLQMKYF
jgi:serine/threonine protein kinase